MKSALIRIFGAIGIIAVVAAAALGVVHVTQARASSPLLTCTATGFFRDSKNLTAAKINPSSTISGTVNATGCNIGVYYGPGKTGNVSNANVYGANYFGVVNNGGKVNVTNSNIHDIGETPLNGDQHGVGIYFAYGTPSQGTISGNTVWNYQKGGIAVNGTTGQLGAAKILNNQVIGQGPVNYIAQNGIEAFASGVYIEYNTVTGNSYTGPNFASSGGIIIVGGAYYGAPYAYNDRVEGNTVTGNDVGIWVSELDASLNPPTTPTFTVVLSNISTNNQINNTTGDGAFGYQAGFADTGDLDMFVNNTACGAGYQNPTPPPYLFDYDFTYTNKVLARGNHSCDGNNYNNTVATSYHNTKHAATNKKLSTVR